MAHALVTLTLFGQATSQRIGTGKEVVWDATWPWWIVSLLVLVAMVLTIRLYRRTTSPTTLFHSRILLGIRCCTLLLLGWMLLGYIRQSHTTDKPDLVVLVDDSASMGLDASVKDFVADGTSNTNSKLSRLDIIQSLFKRDSSGLIAQLAKRYHLRVYLMGATPRAIAGNTSELRAQLADLTATQSTSQQGDSLQEALDSQRGRPTAAVLCVTDGIVTQGISISDAVDQATLRKIPVYFLALGDDTSIPSLEMSYAHAGPTIYRGNAAPFECRLETENLDGEVLLQLIPAEGDQKPLASQSVVISKRNRSPLARLFYRESQLGPHKYILRATYARDGAEPIIRERLLELQVVDPKHRVLLVQGTPTYEFRFLKSFLERELSKPNLAGASRLQTVLQDADPDYASTDPTALKNFPTNRDELFAFDVIILGDVDPKQLSGDSQKNLIDFVAVRGGGLVLIAGQHHLPMNYTSSMLQILLPAQLRQFASPTSATSTDNTEGSFHPRITPLGHASAQFHFDDTRSGLPDAWQDELPAWHWFVPCNELRPGVRILLEHPTEKMRDGHGKPLITLQQLAKGKIVFHATDESYLWRYQAGDAYFGRYWMQLLQMLASEDPSVQGRAKLSTTKQVYQQGETVHFSVQSLSTELEPKDGEGVTLSIIAEDGTETTLSLTRPVSADAIFEGSISDLPLGKYQAKIASIPSEAAQAPTGVTFEVEGPSQELEPKPIPFRMLTQSAEASGGKCLRATEVDDLLDALPAGTEVRIESAPPEPLWNHPLAVGVLAAFLASEWLLRRSWRLA